MATFPTTKYPVFGYRVTHEDFVKENPSSNGMVQVKDMWNRTRFIAEMSFDLRTDDYLLVLFFWKQNRKVAFDFVDYDDDFFDVEQFATGNGVTTTFDLPAKNVRSYAVYVGGVLKVAGTHYNISAGTGSLGKDQVIFTGGNTPAAAAVISWAGIGKHFYKCRFRDGGKRESRGPLRQAGAFVVAEDFGA